MRQRAELPAAAASCTIAIRNDSDTEVSVLISGSHYQQDPIFAGPAEVHPGESQDLTIEFDSGKLFFYSIVEQRSASRFVSQNANLEPSSSIDLQVTFAGQRDSAPLPDDAVPFSQLTLELRGDGDLPGMSDTAARIQEAARELGMTVPGSYRIRRGELRYIGVPAKLVPHAVELRSRVDELTGFPIIVGTWDKPNTIAVRLGRPYDGL